MTYIKQFVDLQEPSVICGPSQGLGHHCLLLCMRYVFQETGQKVVWKAQQTDRQYVKKGGNHDEDRDGPTRMGLEWEQHTSFIQKRLLIRPINTTVDVV